MSAVRCVQVNAFASRPFAGNPAAVCLLDRERDAAWMQAVAAEMNLSETAFVRPVDGGFALRWFTPTVEVDLCGHATLATAHALWEERAAADGVIRFHTRSGILTAGRNGDFIELDFPATPASPVEQVAGLAEALGAEPVAVGRTKFDVLAEFGSEAAVRALRPDFGRVAALRVRGVIVTARSDGPRFDFASRFFAPSVGVDEDPVCGSAHCCLGPYWQERLGKTEVVGHQVSRRGGVVRVRAAGERAVLAGQAVSVWRGELTRIAAEATVEPHVIALG